MLFLRPVVSGRLTVDILDVRIDLLIAVQIHMATVGEQLQVCPIVR